MRAIEKIQNATREANQKWNLMDKTDQVASEKILVTKLIRAYAENGCWDFTIDTLYEETIVWLQKQGFEIHNIDDNVVVCWGSYTWRKNGTRN